MALTDLYCLGMLLNFIRTGDTESNAYNIGRDYPNGKKGFIGYFIGCLIRAWGYPAYKNAEDAIVDVALHLVRVPKPLDRLYSSDVVWIS
jgi:hypothetical protein